MVQTTLRLPVELYQKLKALAKKRGVTINSLVVSTLWDIVEGSGRD